MKCKLIVVLIVLVCASLGFARAAEPNETQKDEAITLWLTGNSPAYQNTNIGVMIGCLNDDIEIGGALDWRKWSEGDTEDDMQSNLAVGIYGIVHFPELIDVNTPLDLPFLPDKLASKPCVGIAYLFDVETTSGEKGTSIPLFAALRIFDLFAIRYEFNIYQGIDVKDNSSLGLSLQWKF